MTHASDSLSEEPSAERSDEAVETVEAYEDDGRTVLYDAENPLAWVETTRAVTLADLA
ncbi:DUF7331 family protein [Halobaculum sp. D14]|uniref:DUF7331 family protein n=1 Tax=unclassified Halobaculum TaxID=2640896 RepID=UPI003EB6B9F8